MKSGPSTKPAKPGAAAGGPRHARTRQRKPRKDDLLKESLGRRLGSGIALIALALGVAVVLCWSVSYSQRVSVQLTVVEAESANARPASPGHVLAVGSVQPSLAGALADGALEVQLEGYPPTRFGSIETTVRRSGGAARAGGPAGLIEVELPATWQTASGGEVRLTPGLRATGSATLRSRLLERLFGGLRSPIPRS